MKFRITPLNIVAAIAACLGVYLLLNPKSSSPNINVNGLVAYLMFLYVLVAFVTDLIFRFTLKKLKKIWLAESLLIVLVVVLMLIFQK